MRVNFQRKNYQLTSAGDESGAFLREAAGHDPVALKGDGVDSVVRVGVPHHQLPIPPRTHQVFRVLGPPTAQYLHQMA